MGARNCDAPIIREYRIWSFEQGYSDREIPLCRARTRARRDLINE